MDIHEIIRQKRALGFSVEEIVRDLRVAGYSDVEIDEALGSSGGAPVASNGNRRLDPLELFTYGLTYASLYPVLWSVISTINKFIDARNAVPFLTPNGFTMNPGKPEVKYSWELAFLIVFGATLVLLSLSTHRTVTANPEKRHSPFRSWLTYITLAILSFNILFVFAVMLSALFDGNTDQTMMTNSAVTLFVHGFAIAYYGMQAARDRRAA